MLNKIYEYAKANGLNPDDERYQATYIAKYCCLDENGDFSMLESVDDKSIKAICPKAPAKLKSSNQSDFIAEKAVVVFNSAPEGSQYNKKHLAYMEMLRNASKLTKIVYNFINSCRVDNLEGTETSFMVITPDGEVFKLKKTDVVSFRVGLIYLEEDDSWKPYFEAEYEKLHNKAYDKDCKLMVSAITGVPVSAVRTGASFKVPIVLPRAAPPISCDKEAFNSYGLEATFNCAMSYDENVTINNGIQKLLSEEHYIREIDLVHWFSKPGDANPLSALKSDLDNINEIIKEEGFDEIEAIGEEDTFKDVNLSRKIKAFLKSEKITSAATSDNIFCYFNFYAPAQGRILLCNYREESAAELLNNLNAFYENSTMSFVNYNKESKKYFIADECITSLFGLSMALNPKVDKFQDIKSDFKPIKDSIVNNAIEGKPLDKRVIKRIISIIRKTEKVSIEIDGVKNKSPLISIHSIKSVYKLLRLYLCQLDEKERGGEILPMLNKENTNPAYLCGRYFAVLEKLQADATAAKTKSNKNRGNDFAVAHYALASTKPDKGFSGRTARLAEVYMKTLFKEKREGSAVYYSKLINEILGKLEKFPAKLSIEEQGLFAIGRAHQKEELFTKKTSSSCQAEQDVQCE